MPYRLLTNESIEAGIRRIAREQVSRANAEARPKRLSAHEAVHQARKRCKKIRGLLRLVRPALSDRYSFENKYFRDAARDLSFVRDAEAIIETFDKLLVSSENSTQPRLASVRNALAQRRESVMANDVDIEKRLRKFQSRMKAAHDRISHWRLDENGFKAVADGLQKTYKRGREAMRASTREPTPQNFHEWRKRTKYHWHHLRLVQEIWPPVIRGFRMEAKRLSDILGDEHDLSVLRRILLESPEEFGKARDRRSLLRLIDERSATLKRDSINLGERVYAEKPGELRKRLSRYWRTWRV